METTEAAMNSIHEATLVNGSPENYSKWVKDFEADVKAQNYEGPQSVCAKWQSYHAQLLRSDSKDDSSVKHKVFDAGCGTGMVGEKLYSCAPPEVIEVYGGDLSSDMIEVARKKNVYTDLKIVDLKGELPYEADTFDSIVCAGTFIPGHCGPESLSNLIRVLKKRCYLIATVRKIFYEETRVEWGKRMKECNCKLLEEVEMPYLEDIKAIVLVICKQ